MAEGRDTRPRESHYTGESLGLVITGTSNHNIHMTMMMMMTIELLCGGERGIGMRFLTCLMEGRGLVG